MAIIKISRFDAESKKTYVDSYKIEINENITLLDVLLKIKEELDGSLAFEYGCKSGLDGSDGINVNKRPVLASQANVSKIIMDYKSEEILIEPLSNFPLIKDLVVDKSGLWNSYANTNPFLIERKLKRNEKPAEIGNDVISKISKLNDCNLCGLCNSSCEILKIDNEFIGPAILAMSLRQILDVRDGELKTRIKSSVNRGLWKCSQFMSCNDVCPKDIEPSFAISDIRIADIKNKISSRGPKYVNSAAKEFRNTGKIRYFSKNKSPVKNSQQIPVIYDDVEERENLVRKKLPCYYKEHEDYAEGYFK